MPARGPTVVPGTRQGSAAGPVLVSGEAEAEARAAWYRKVEGSPLTARQRRFVIEYIVDVCATQAALRAGYSERTAARLGSRLLQNPDIAALLAEHAHQVAAVRGLEVKRIEEELAHSALFDPIDI